MTSAVRGPPIGPPPPPPPRIMGALLKTTPYTPRYDSTVMVRGGFQAFMMPRDAVLTSSSLPHNRL